MLCAIGVCVALVERIVFNNGVRNDWTDSHCTNVIIIIIMVQATSDEF